MDNLLERVHRLAVLDRDIAQDKDGVVMCEELRSGIVQDMLRMDASLDPRERKTHNHMLPQPAPYADDRCLLGGSSVRYVHERFVDTLMADRPTRQGRKMFMEKHISPTLIAPTNLDHPRAQKRHAAHPPASLFGGAVTVPQRAVASRPRRRREPSSAKVCAPPIEPRDIFSARNRLLRLGLASIETRTATARHTAAAVMV